VSPDRVVAHALTLYEADASAGDAYDTLVYTAITRPADRLILMGNERVIDQAIARGSIALERKTCLRERVMLAEMSA
jgi:hypothetical protein